MATAVSGRAFHNRLSLRNGFLRKRRQSGVLAEHRDYRFSLPPGRPERGGNSRHVLLNCETRLPQLRFQQLRALVFFITDFGKLPDLPRYVTVMSSASVHLFEELFLIAAQDKDSTDENPKECPHGGHDSLTEAKTIDAMHRPR